MRLRTVFILMFCLLSLQIVLSQTRIKMENEGGVYKIPSEVNGLRLKFIFDTGASYVTLPLATAKLMLDNGYLNSEDIFDDLKIQTADGSVVSATKIIIKEMNIGGIRINNVEAVVMNQDYSPLLLGQSAISKLGKIHIELDELVISNSKELYSEEEIEELFRLVEQYEKLKMDVALSKTLQTLFDLNQLSDFGIFKLAMSYTTIGEYEKALIYCKFVENNEDFKSTVLNMMALCYQQIGDNNNALLYNQKAYPYLDDDPKTKYYYSSVSSIYNAIGNCRLFLENSKKALYYQLLSKKINLKSVIKNRNADKDLMRDLFILGGGLIDDCQLFDDGSYYLSIAAYCGHSQSLSLCSLLSIDFIKVLQQNENREN